MKAKKIIAIYLRLSSEDKDEDKDESNSITNQRFLLHSFIRKFPLDEYEVVEYVDDGYTGKNLDRPGMQRMLQDIRDRKVAIVVVKDFPEWQEIISLWEISLIRYSHSFR